MNLHLPDRDAVFSWFIAAPPAVLLSLMIGLASWVWALDSEISNYNAMAAVAAEKARDAQTSLVVLDGRLERLDAKTDVMMELLIELRAAMRRIDKEKTK